MTIQKKLDDLEIGQFFFVKEDFAQDRPLTSENLTLYSYLNNGQAIPVGRQWVLLKRSFDVSTEVILPDKVFTTLYTIKVGNCMAGDIVSLDGHTYLVIVNGSSHAILKNLEDYTTIRLFSDVEVYNDRLLCLEIIVEPIGSLRYVL